MAWAILGRMTDRPDQASSPPIPAPEPQEAQAPPPPVAEDPSLMMVRALCPYLIAADGDWRSVAPTRDHRCAAVDPWAPLAPDKQARLCLVAAHLECSTFLAARRVLIPVESPAAPVVDDRGPEGSDPGRPGSGQDAHGSDSLDASAATGGAGRWPVPSTAPVVVGRSRGGIPTLPLDRSLAQAGLVVLMILAFVVLAVARLTDEGGSTTPASPSPMATPVVSPAPSGSGGPTAAPTRTTAPTATAPVPASAGPSPSALSPSSTAPTSYRVRSGDTLSAIAARHGTTVAVLVALNDIADPGTIRVGQVLRLP